MAYIWQRWLAREFRAAGLKVIEVGGWRNRGRPASTGHFDPRGPSTVHHTGTRSGPDNNAPSLSVLITGRSDLPGPLCQYAVAYDGTVYIIAAGRANHAGSVGKPGVTGMPLGADGNALAIGDEVMTDGTQDLPTAQRRSIAVCNAVVLRRFGRDPEYAHRHADISGTGKWDIGQLTTAQVRTDAEEAMAGGPPPEDDMPTPDEFLDEPINVHDPKGQLETRSVTLREVFTALVIQIERGPKAAREYLDDARRSRAPK